MGESRTLDLRHTEYKTAHSPTEYREMRSFDVYWETSPLFVVSKIFGIAPYNEFFRLSKIHTPFTLLVLSLILSDALYIGFYMEKVNDSFQLSVFSLILERFQLMMVILTVVVCMTKSIKSVKLMRMVMENLGSVDDYLARIFVEEKPERCEMYFTLFVRFFSLLSLMLVDCVVSKMYRKLDSILVECILMYPLIIINTVETQFIVLLNVVKRRMIVVTEKLDELTKKSRRNINMEVLQVLATVHSSLVDICDDINALFSHQILMIFSGIFILNTTNLYHVVEKLIVFVSTKNARQLNFDTITLYRVLVRAYEGWTVVTSCSKTHEKVFYKRIIFLNTFETFLTQIRLRCFYFSFQIDSKHLDEVKFFTGFFRGGGGRK